MTLARKFVPWLAPLLMLACAPPAHAQSIWDSIKHKVADKVSDTAAQTLEKSMSRHADNDASPSSDDSRHPMLTINGGGHFTAGNVPLVTGTLADTAVGAMPSAWKTNGSAALVTMNGVPGKWLKINPWSTLKLTKPPRLPRHFTVQFDVIAVADKIQDLDALKFGFAHDNSVRNYISDAYNDGAINAVALNYMNRGGGSISSSATGNHSPFEFGLEGYANRPLHVAIDVDGDNMSVYLDHRKVGDSKMFLGHKPRYFFISYGLKNRHGSALVFGNFRIDGFKTASP